MLKTRKRKQAINHIQQLENPPQKYIHSGISHTSSWNKLRVQFQPIYEDQKQLQEQLDLISDMSQIVTHKEIQLLSKELKACENGKKIFVQMGDCAESFSEQNSEFLDKKMKAIIASSKIIKGILNKNCLTIGRIAGQFSKPRSQDFEILSNGEKVCTFRGDIVNTIEKRTPDPLRLAKGYQFINFIIKNENNNQNIYISHEGLLLNYEETLTRMIENKYYATSAHLLWIGERTRQLDGAHIEFFKGIENSIGVKIGPSIKKEEFLKLVQTLNPLNLKGKLMIITRLGSNMIEQILPELIEVKKQNNLNFIWSCDPMHANTFTSSVCKGKKTRKVDEILKELKLFVDILSKNQQHIGGIHLETSAINVTECVGVNLEENDLDKNYTTLCDPRLNIIQSLFVCEQFSNYVKFYQK
ncbi:phospho-2-dehydro-3-deoxyheptonate aldolase, putative [Ichthyophthirius multifiliis]|uniref:Phospho-2-dehydro-3-deoxyheptonate aldolase n=1 Tax=Ichthyophthirius multifiliis TaxID=5932 RepID=G0QN00_ICHMU|nr:phospho-2-dehydro-3-deoxyheptonate aldolase, putative [Ichthyophthirius multifiliis]EGR33415.1 phospho-2-dehydro-3-deoxyheptonate aldolase, putative [Ichthyophthirius multifiliis]|eukprot:XP_004037401.1 phospho-2-dehydro-3-deoxyheptonate aldolase, putative [Ichthyophthirius multifiliis]